ncbi:MAG: ABC transporter permease [Actinobacteria bacterium]|nr:ABC transporter permease [Actinomycetota bacterium]
MNLNLFLTTLYQRRIGMFWFSFGLVAYSWLMAWTWTFFGDMYEQLLETMPPEMIAVWVPEDLEAGTLGGYFQTEYLGVMWVLIVAVAIIIFAVKSISSEVAEGTMELLLAQPIARLQFIVTRIAAMFVYAAVLTTATFLPIQILGPTYDIEIPGRTMALLYATSFLLVAAIGSFAMMLSAAMRSGGRPGAITGSLLAAMWIMQAIAPFVEVVEDLEPINLLTYWQPGDLINDGVVMASSWWVYGAIMVVSLVVAVVAFLRRDLT